MTRGYRSTRRPTAAGRAARAAATALLAALVSSRPTFAAAAAEPTTRPSTSPATAVRPSPSADAIVRTPGLVAFWDFQEPAGGPRASKGPAALPLREAVGPVDRAGDGLFGPHAARLKVGQWFVIPRAEQGPLNIGGKAAAVTVLAWVKREKKQGAWQAVAGVWDESRGKRQYCLFLDAAARTRSDTFTRDPSRDRVHGHVSAVGGPTPGNAVCVTYSSGGTQVPLGQWRAVAMTYDGKFSRAYVDGRLDASDKYNPFPYDQGLFDGGPDGADFTVGSVSVKGKPSNFYAGLIGGVAVFDRALTDDEVRALSGAAPR
jgi:hypothetical protein